MEQGKNFNDKFLKAKLAKGIKVTDPNVTGLMCEPSPSGGKWTMRFVSPISHKRRAMGLGTYPMVSIAEVRELAREQRKLIAKGIDPIADRERNAAILKSEPSVPTFEEAAQLVHANLKPSWRNTKHAAQWIATLQTYAYPTIGKKLLTDILPKDCAEALNPIWLIKPDTASRTKQRMHAVFAWAWAHGHIGANPVDVVDYLLPKQNGNGKEHQPAMPWQDCASFIAEHLSKRAPGDSVRAALEFLILTAARSGEVREMTWDEVDFDKRLWIVPANRTKTGVWHRVPLSRRAVEILEEQRDAHLHPTLVFPSPRGLVLSDMALTALLRRVEAKSDIPGRTATAHGFRSSFRDWASENGYASEAAERALAHTVRNKVEAAYHRTDLLDARRDMTEEWSAICSSGAVRGGN
jgi:integrase